MLLWLLRHGDAESPPGVRDADRTLSPVGKGQADRVGRFLARVGGPDIILTSPLTRAVETATIVSKHLQRSVPKSTDKLLSSAAPSAIVNEVAKRKEASLLLVGHEPLMSTLVAYLVDGTERSIVRMSPCTLALIRTAAKPRPAGGVLDLLIPPESLVIDE